MVQKNTLLKITDNSGARQVKFLQIFKKEDTIFFITVSIQKLRKKTKLKIKKNIVLNAVLLRINLWLKQKNGFFFNFKDNSAILLNNQKNPLGTKIFGLVPRKFKKKISKLISLSYYLI